MYTPEYLQFLKSLAVNNSICIFRNKNLEGKVVISIEAVTKDKMLAIKVYDILPNEYIYFDLRNGLKIDFCAVCSGKKFTGYNNNIFIHHPLRLVK